MLKKARLGGHTSGVRVPMHETCEHQERVVAKSRFGVKYSVCLAIYCPVVY